MKLYFISQPSSKSTLPFAGLQHMQQCQVKFHSIFASCFDPNEWCMKKGLHSGGLNPRPLSHESSALTTRKLPISLLSLKGWIRADKLLVKDCSKSSFQRGQNLARIFQFNHFILNHLVCTNFSYNHLMQSTKTHLKIFHKCQIKLLVSWLLPSSDYKGFSKTRWTLTLSKKNFSFCCCHIRSQSGDKREKYFIFFARNMRWCAHFAVK